MNRLVLTSYPDSTNQSISYDNIGNIISIKSANSSTTTYAYNALDRMSNVMYSNGALVKYTHDRIGNVLSMTDKSGTTYYTYNALSEITNKTEIINGISGTYTILLSYNNKGQVTSMTYPNNFNLTLKYDFQGRPIQAGGFANLSYTAQDMLESIRFANGVNSVSYYSRLRVSRILDKLGATKLLDLNYSFDSTGNQALFRL